VTGVQTCALPIYFSNMSPELDEPLGKSSSGLRPYFPQILAVSVANILLLVDGMTLGVSTIIIPAVDDNISKGYEDLTLTKSEISLLSKFILLTAHCCALTKLLIFLQAQLI